MITLGIIEDQAAIREALCEYLGAQPEFDCVLCAASHEEFMAALPTLLALPTLVLSDIGLPGRSGIEGLTVMRQVLPQAEVLMLSVYTDAERVFEALRAGAVGYLEKTTSAASAQRAPAASGGRWLAHEPKRGPARYAVLCPAPGGSSRYPSPPASMTSCVVLRMGLATKALPTACM